MVPALPDPPLRIPFLSDAFLSDPSLRIPPPPFAEGFVAILRSGYFVEGKQISGAKMAEGLKGDKNLRKGGKANTKTGAAQSEL